MSANARDVLCRYHYDPLDRLVGTTPTDDDGLQRFYCKSRLATEVQGAVQRSIFQKGEQLLAQQNQQDDLIETSLLATDQMRSVLRVSKTTQSASISYSAYGHRPTNSGLLSSLGFNGERSDPITGYYFLGNGYRAFNPVLMRFNSPDNLSPFGYGGLNSYAYCLGDPVNRFDGNGHFSMLGGVSQLQTLLSRKIAKYFKPTSKTKVPNIQKLINTKGGSVQNNATEQFMNLHPERLKKEHRARVKLQGKDPNIIMQITSGDDLAKLKYEAQYKFVMHSDDSIFMGGPTHLGAGTDLKHSVLSYRLENPEVITAGMARRSNIDGIDVVTLINKSGHHRTTENSLVYAVDALTRMGANVRSGERPS